MKIFALTIVILALNGYVTRATSLDPLENVEIDETKTDRDDSRTKRSGNIFSSLLKKKFGLLSSITGTSSGKSIGHLDSFPEHFEEPLSYHTKSFNLWGVKKAIMSSVFQAAKAITGGVIALKGQLIKAKGHAVVAKGKLMQTKGEAISNFGKTIATHAFDVHHEPQLDVHSSVGLFNHLPVSPVHQPTSYGAATAFGYQGQAYPSNAYQSNAYQSNAYPSNAYQVAAPSYQTGFGVQQTGYDGGVGYGGYGGNGFTAKRAVVQNSQESTAKQVQSAFDKDSVHAGLLIFKPIKMPVQNVPAAGNLVTSQSTASSQQGIIGQRPSQQLGFNPASFKTPQQGFGFQKQFPAGFQGDVLSNEYSSDLSPGYQVPDFGYQAPNPGYQAQNPVYQAPNPGYQASNPGYQAPNLGHRVPNLGYPSNGGSAEQQTAGHGYGGGPQNFDFQLPADSQELSQQLAAISGQQLQQTSFSQESLNGGDQHDLASGTDERMAQPSYKRASQAINPKRGVSASTGPSTRSVTGDFDDGEGAKTKKRSAPLPPTHGDVIVPLKYHDDSSAEDQARLKQTVQRFFSMLQKQRSHGQLYDAKKYPYVVTVSADYYNDEGESMTSHCTGSLVKPLYVLTVAHCIYQRPASGISIHLGAKANNIVRMATEHYIPLHYSKNESIPITHDIGVIKLETPFSNFNKFVKIGGTPKDFENYKPVECTFIGFGNIENNARMEFRGLMITRNVTYGRTACRGYDRKEFELYWDEYLCMTAGSRAMTCSGDSGGPMICKGKLYGLCSFMINYKQGKIICGGADIQTVHTFIYSHLKWVNNIIDPGANKKKKKKKNSGNLINPHLSLQTILTILLYSVLNIILK